MKTKDTWQRNFWQILPFILLGAAYAVRQMSFPADFGDDIAFANALESRTLWQFVIMRYQIWTSRILWEPFTVLFLSNAFTILLWRLGSTLCVIFLAWFFTRLAWRAAGNEKLSSAWISCITVFCVPWELLKETGTVCTSLLYQWALAAAAAAALPLLAAPRRVPGWQLCLGAVMCVWAANMEQVCVLLLFLMGGYTLYRLIAGKGGWHYSAVCTILCGLELVFHLVICPGNRARLDSEIIYWFGDYNMLSLPQKMEMAFSSTMLWVVDFGELFWGCAYLLIAIVCLKNARSILLCLIGCAPFSLWFILGFLPENIAAFPKMLVQLTHWGTITIENSGNPMAYLPFLIWAAFLTLLVCSVYIAMGHGPRTLLAEGLLAVGFGTRLMMGLSPTIWASGERIFLILHICMAAVVILCLAAWRGKQQEAQTAQ